MFILADYFVGNIKNTNVSYLRKDRFYYSNDGKFFTSRKILKEDLHEGTLSSFYTYFTVHEWFPNKEQLKEIKAFEKDKKIFIQVVINENNEVLKILPVHDIEGPIIEPLETVYPANNKTTIYIDGCVNVSAFENELEKDNLAYSSYLCIPNMTWRNDIGKYVFKTMPLIDYVSDGEYLYSAN